MPSLPMRCRVTTEDGDCNQHAAILILTNESCIDAADPEVNDYERLHAWPVCSEHAPEQIHEARGSMADDEFAVRVIQ